ncbi:MAG: hypothetical protein AAGA85_09365 [Bacteroidota bacterium]
MEYRCARPLLWVIGVVCLLDLSSCQSNTPIEIDIWYGSEQVFGEPGLAQRWINILGQATAPNGLRSLAYSLNGSKAERLTWGSDLHRLAKLGDFNVDLDTSDLKTGWNELEIVAEDSIGNKAKAKVRIDFRRSGDPWPLPFEIKWREVDRLQDIVQIVDGSWYLTKEGVRNQDVYYDRMLAFGDASWINYEVVTSVTFHSFTPPVPGPPTYNVSHAAIAVYWPGHGVDERQPHRQWYPLGATAEFRLTQDLDSCRWRIFDGPKPEHENFYSEQEMADYRSIKLNTAYGMKHRVTDLGGDSTMYQVKLWDLNIPEPVDWDFTAVERQQNIRSGGAGLLAHNTEVTFGDVRVVLVDTLK